MLLQLWEFSCGKQCLNELDDPLLYTSCGDILEQLQQPLEAAEPYLKAGNESASKFLDLLVEEEEGLDQLRHFSNYWILLYLSINEQ